MEGTGAGLKRIVRFNLLENIIQVIKKVE